MSEVYHFFVWLPLCDKIDFPKQCHSVDILAMNYHFPYCVILAILLSSSIQYLWSRFSLFMII